MQQDTVDHLEEGTTEVAQEDVMEAEPMEAADVTVAPKGLMAKAV